MIIGVNLTDYRCVLGITCNKPHLSCLLGATFIHSCWNGGFEEKTDTLSSDQVSVGQLDNGFLPPQNREPTMQLMSQMGTSASDAG